MIRIAVTCVGLCFLAAIFLMTTGHSARAQQPIPSNGPKASIPDPKMFDQFAAELIAGINSTSSGELSPRGSSIDKKAYLKKNYAYVSGKKLRIAVWPFHQDNIPIAKSIADGFNDQLLNALFKLPGRNIEFIARDGLKVIIADMDETGTLDSDDDPIAALMAKVRDVDALIQGRMRLTEKGLSLGYKAVRMDGTILAQTARLEMPLSQHDKFTRNDQLTIDQAVNRASKFFANHLTDLTEIRIGGLHFQETGLQPPFATFFKGKLVAALQRHFANVLTDRRIKVRDSRLLREIGPAPVKANSLKENNFAKLKSSYLLTGRYWVLRNTVELRLSLKNPTSYALSWTGRLPIEEVNGLQLKPAGDFENLRENDGLGPFEFYLTSARGRNPVYHIGENLSLLLRVGVDAWTYCFYHQADGNVIQIFPNPHFWRDFHSPRLAGGKIHTIPGKIIFPFDLKVTAPAGRELVKCFGASRDITQDLPDDLRGQSLKPLTKNRVGKLSELFRNLPYTAIAEASLVVTVAE